MPEAPKYEADPHGDRETYLRQRGSEIAGQITGDPGFIASNTIIIVEGFDGDGDPVIHISATKMTMWNHLGMLEYLSTVARQGITEIHGSLNE